MQRGVPNLTRSYQLAVKLHQLRTGRLPRTDLICTECETCVDNDECVELVTSAIRIELFKLMGIKESILDHTDKLIPFTKPVTIILIEYAQEMIDLFGIGMHRALNKKDSLLIQRAFIKCNNLVLLEDNTLEQGTIIPDRRYAKKAEGRRRTKKNNPINLEDLRVGQRHKLKTPEQLKKFVEKRRRNAVHC